MKRFFVFIVCILITISMSTYGVFAQGGEKHYSWYCIRNKEHKQPRLDGEVSFIEDYGGFHVDKKHGDSCSEKIVYLTFDAGYENGNVEKTLDILKEEQVCGAFFILGNLITSNTDLVKRMIKEGHTVCNHTYSHKDLTSSSKEEFAAELARLEAVYLEYTGATLAKYYRPPEGKFSRATMRYADELGYKTIFWSFAYADWDNNKQMSPEAAKEKILSNIHNGAVLLLHPTSSTNARILGDIIRELKAQGYVFGTLDQLTV